MAPFTFSPEDIKRIEAALATTATREGATVRFALQHPESGRHITVEIRDDLPIPEDIAVDGPANLVSVYAASSFLQLHRCTGYIASEDFGEVIFFARDDGSTSGLVIEREAACSLYANVDDTLISTDFSRLPPELIMSSVALSMTESLFDDKKDE